MPNCLNPAYNSLTGSLLSAVESGIGWESLEFNDSIFHNVCVVAKRVLLSLEILVTSTIDFAVLLLMTIVVLPAGGSAKDHLINIISSLFNTVAAFRVLFGYRIERDPSRKFLGNITDKVAKVFAKVIGMRRRASIEAPAQAAQKGNAEIEQEIRALTARVGLQSREENLKESAVLIKQFIEFMFLPYRSTQMMLLHSLLTAFAENGVDLNISVSVNDIDEYRLIHCLSYKLAEQLRCRYEDRLTRAKKNYFEDYKTEAIWQLIELALDNNIDPSPNPVSSNSSVSMGYKPPLINVLMLSGNAELIRCASTKWPKLFDFSKPLKDIALYDFGIKIFFQDEFRRSKLHSSALLIAMYETIESKTHLKFIATLLDTIQPLSKFEKAIIGSICNTCMLPMEKFYASATPVTDFVIGAISLSATPVQQEQAANTLLQYGCFNLLKTMQQEGSYIAETDINSWFFRAIRYQEVEYIRNMLDLFPLLGDKKLTEDMQLLRAHISQPHLDWLNGEDEAGHEVRVKADKEARIKIVSDVVEKCRGQNRKHLEGQLVATVTILPPPIASIVAEYACLGLAALVPKKTPMLLTREIAENTEKDDIE